MNKEDEIAEQLFLEELKSEYSKGLDLKNALDSKANSIVTTSIMSSTLLIAVGTFLLSVIPLLTLYFVVLLILFGAGIVFALLALGYSLKSFRIKDYIFAVNEESFFDDKNNLIEKKIDETRFKKRTEFVGGRIKDYLICLRFNIINNQKKSNEIRNSQLLLIISISLISAFILVLLLSGIISFSQ